MMLTGPNDLADALQRDLAHGLVPSRDLLDGAEGQAADELPLA